MPSKKSGGKRAVEKKHAERNAERARGGKKKWCKAWLKLVEQLGNEPRDTAAQHQWLARAALMIVRATLSDVGLPFEQLRRDAMRQIEQASKVLNPAQLSEELAELEEAQHKLEQEIQELRDAGDVSTRTHQPPSPSPPLS